MSNNTTNEISILRAIKRMTICELEELNSKIQEFLNSQDVKITKSSDTGKTNIKSQEICNSFGVKKLTSGELGKLRLKVQEILISHEMKFIKNSRVGEVFDSVLEGEVLRVA